MNSKTKFAGKPAVSQPKPIVGSTKAVSLKNTNNASLVATRFRPAAVAPSSLSCRLKPTSTSTTTATTNSRGQKAPNKPIISRSKDVTTITTLKSSLSVKDVEDTKKSSKCDLSKTSSKGPPPPGHRPGQPVRQRALSKAVVPVKQSPSRGVTVKADTCNVSRKSLTGGGPSPGGTRRSLTRGVPAIRRSLTRASPIPVVGLGNSPLSKPATRLKIAFKRVEIEKRTPEVVDNNEKLKKDKLNEENKTMIISKLQMRNQDLEEQLTTNTIKTKLDDAMNRIKDLELDKDRLVHEMKSLKLKHELEMETTVQDCAKVIKCGVSFWDETKEECEKLKMKNSELQAQLDRLLLEAGRSRKDQKLSELRKASGGVSVRNALLKWCQNCVKNYPEVEITNFSSSWVDGNAFCILLHSLDPSLVDMEKVDGSSTLEKFEIVVAATKKLGVKMDLDIKSIVSSGEPSWELIMNYVSEIYAAASK
ncbi:unnamed protein product [Orchesella dallaii]|uniref:Calponin-homology (CH) domain-containing protein n=1 Tax=Orchesella dallaii TaxID=48710 RepID=A0ABP1RQV5_9HEXA